MPLHRLTGAEVSRVRAAPPGTAGKIRRRQEVQAGERLQARRRPAHRHHGTGGRRRTRMERDQVLLGVTGSGKTFTMAKVIEATQRPALILAPNKTLAAQLYSEFKTVLPGERGRVFRQLLRLLPAGSLYPAHRHLYREGQLDQRRDRPHAPFGDAGDPGARRCDHRGLGVVHLRHRLGGDLFRHRRLASRNGDKIDRKAAIGELVALQYRRNDDNFTRGAFRVRGDTIDIFPAHYEDRAWRVELFGDVVDSITEFDPLTGHKAGELDAIKVYANSHYVTPRPTLQQAMKGIKAELITAAGGFPRQRQIAGSAAAGAAHHLRPGDDRGHGQLRRDRELFPLADRPQAGRAAAHPVRISARQCPGLRRRKPCHACRRSAPCTKATIAANSRLSEYGFRLPSCIDNRPLKFEEWDAMRPQSVYVSATPGPWEMERTGGIFAEQVIRPTGLDRSAGRDPPGGNPGGRPDRRMPRDRQARLSRPGHHPDQEDGGRPDRIYARAGHPRALHAFATWRRWSGSRSSAICGWALSTC